jgi:ElaB/YqjD/DUF883 family membrane-anchored ribosome-binding protein
MAQTPNEDSRGDSKKTEEVRQRARVVRDDVRELGRAAKGAAEETYEDVKRQAGEYVERKKQRVTEFEDQIVEYVREKPLQSVLIAVGVGAVIGLLLRRR